MLATVAWKYIPDQKSFYRLAGIGGLLHLISGFASLSVFNAFWTLDILLLAVIPFVAAMKFRQEGHRVITLFQSLILLLFVGCAASFNLDYPDLGVLFYVMVALFQPILGVIFIISSIRLSRRVIMERERDFSAFFDSINEVFFRAEPQGIIREVSPSISQFGYKAKQIQGRNLASFLPGSEEFIRKLNPISGGKKPIEYKGAFLSPKGPVDCEIVCSFVRDPEKDSFYVAGSIRNTQERNLLEHQFIEAQRHESLGMLAGGMAHDFNNLLQGIIGYTEILQESHDLDEQTKNKGLNAIMKAATTAGGLCKQLLQYTGKGIRPNDTFDVSGKISEVLDILAPSCPTDVHLNAHLPEQAAIIQGIRTRLDRCFLT